jgi:hypothetical protein
MLYLYIYIYVYIYVYIHVYIGKKDGFLFQNGIKGQGYYIAEKSKNFKNINNEIDTKNNDKKNEKTEIENPVIPIIQKVEINKNDSNSIFLPFPYDYRQTKQAIAILVQVPNISADSTIVYFNENSVNVSFKVQNLTGIKFYTCIYVYVCQTGHDYE